MCLQAWVQLASYLTSFQLPCSPHKRCKANKSQDRASMVRMVFPLLKSVMEASCRLSFPLQVSSCHPFSLPQASFPLLVSSTLPVSFTLPASFRPSSPLQASWEVLHDTANTVRILPCLA